MELIFRTAKHYWLNGENATWSVSDSFDASALRWFKNQYSQLEHERFLFKVFQHKTIFFFYLDNKDVYGRNIVEITAILVNVLFTDPENVRPLIAKHLKQIPQKELDFTIFIADSFINNIQANSPDPLDNLSRSRSKKTTTIFSLVTVFALFFCSVSIFLFR